MLELERGSTERCLSPSKVRKKLAHSGSASLSDLLAAATSMVDRVVAGEPSTATASTVVPLEAKTEEAAWAAPASVETTGTAEAGNAGNTALGTLMVVLPAINSKEDSQPLNARLRWDISAVDCSSFACGQHLESPVCNLGTALGRTGSCTPDCCLHFWPCWGERCHCVKLILHSGDEVDCCITVDGQTKGGRTMYQAGTQTSVLAAFFAHSEQKCHFSNVDVEVLLPEAEQEEKSAADAELAEIRALKARVRELEESSSESIAAQRSLEHISGALETTNIQLRTSLQNTPVDVQHHAADGSLTVKDQLARKSNAIDLTREEAVSELLAMEVEAAELTAALQAERQARVALAGAPPEQQEQQEQHQQEEERKREPALLEDDSTSARELEIPAKMASCHSRSTGGEDELSTCETLQREVDATRRQAAEWEEQCQMHQSELSESHVEMRTWELEAKQLQRSLIQASESSSEQEQHWQGRPHSDIVQEDAKTSMDVNLLEVWTEGMAEKESMVQRCHELVEQNAELRGSIACGHEEVMQLRSDIQAWSEWGRGIVQLQESLLKEQSQRRQQEVEQALMDEQLQHANFKATAEARQVLRLTEELHSCETLAAEQSRQLQSIKRLSDEIRHRPRLPTSLVGVVGPLAAPAFAGGGRCDRIS